MKKITSFKEYDFQEIAAVVVDISPILKGLDTMNCNTFNDLARVLYDKICFLFGNFQRVDLIFDQYFKKSLKENIRDERGIGSRLLFDETTKLPSKFNLDFLKNSANKDDLSRFLAKKFIEMHTNPQQILVVTYEHSIISSNPSLQFENDIAQCQSEEADQRVIRHVLNLKATSKYKNILACTYDTDVLMLLISYSHLFSSTSIDLICQFGFGDKKKYYCIKTIASSIGPDKCKALPLSMHFQDVQ